MSVLRSSLRPLALPCVLAFAVLTATGARADDARPLTLSVKQADRDTYEVRFQTPMRGNARLRVSLRLPEGARVVEDSLDRRAAGDSLIERFTFELAGGLVGHTLGVEGLAFRSRNALVTVRWLDGRVLRAVLGATRPTITVEPLLEEERVPWTREVAVAAREGFVRGLTRPAHLLLAVALVLAFVGTPAVATWVLALASFLAMALLGALFGPLPGLTLDVADALVALAAAFAAREALLGRQRRLVFLTLVAGLAYGLAEPEAGTTATTVPLQLASALGLDLAHLLVASLALLVFSLVRAPGLRKVVAWPVGVLAVIVAFGLATRPDVHAAVRPTAALPMPIAMDESGASGAQPTMARGMITDVEAYLDVGVFGTRLEILGRLDTFARWLGLERPAGAMIEVDAQEALLDRIATRLRATIEVGIDGETTAPDAVRKGFATQDATGTYLRDEPQPEAVADALVGVTLAFRTPAIPRAVLVGWHEWPTGLAEMRGRVIDPEVSREITIVPAQPVVRWTNELTEDPLPPVAAIQVRTPPVPLPVLSLLLVVLAFVGSAVLFAKALRPTANVALRVGLALAVLGSPLLTVDVSAWFPAQPTPTDREARAITQSLLDGVYRAFNVRDESAVYDRLALSLADETREAAYLENRRALAFERVGGARTHVDAVELTDLEEVQPVDGGGYEALARWTVAGSVTHFGHRHLRQNAYRARLRVVPVEGAWQIRTFDIEDLQRTR